MARLTSISMILITLVISPGCKKQSSKKPQAAVKPEPVAAVEQPSAPEAEPESNQLSEPQASADEPKAASLPNRFVILARGGPLLIDVVLTVEGRPYDEKLARLVDRVLDAGDTDGDGKPTWSEWRENEEFLEGELGNLDSVQPRTVNNWVKRYDTNEDDKIQRVEAASWLGRDGGRSAKALSLRSSRSYFASAASSSRLWQLLDADGDRRLSVDELDQASKQLSIQDTNDDRVIDASELIKLRDQFDTQRNQRRIIANRSSRDAAVHLTDASEARRLDFILADLYAPRQQLGPKSFAARQLLFAALDENNDQWLSGSELEAMLHVEPHLKLSLNFTSDDSPRAALTLESQSSEIVSVTRPRADRIVLDTADTRLAISAHDLGVGQGDRQIVQRNQLRLMVHDQGDGLFELLDANANGRLDEREIVTATERLRRSDTDGNQQLTEEELPYSMTLAFLRSEEASERSFYTPAFAPLPRESDEGPTWFHSADYNNDGDLSRAEFLGTASQFAELDGNGDGFISTAEAAPK